MTQRRVGAILCLLTWMGPVLRAQENRVPVTSLVVGDIVRFRTNTADLPTRAVVAEMTDTGLLVETGSKGDSSAQRKSLRLSFADFTSLEVARGKRSQAGKGAKLGALIGGGGTILLVAANGGLVGACEGGCGLYFLAGGLGGALAGALVGAVTGLAFNTDRFTRVNVETVRVGLHPGSRGLGASLTISF